MAPAEEGVPARGGPGGLPRVLVLTGSSDYPFARLLSALPALAASGAASEVRVQSALPVPPAIGIVPLGVLSRDALDDEIRRADVVVSHAGSGTALAAVRAGHRPILVPRRRAHGEGVDDHQVDLATELERRGDAVLASDPLASSLPALVRAARPRASRAAPVGLGAVLRRVVEGRRATGRLGGWWARSVGAAAYSAFYARCPVRNPLQSAAWGVARREDGWRPRWWLAGAAGRPASAGVQVLVRARGLPGYVPYGPVRSTSPESARVASALLRRLAGRSPTGLLWVPGVPVDEMRGLGRRSVALEADSTTGLLDLRGGDEPLLRAMDREWRRLLLRASEDPAVEVDWPRPSELLPSVLAASRALAEERRYKPPVALPVASRFAEEAAGAGVALIGCTVKVGGEDASSYVAAVAGETCAALWIANWKADPGAGRLVLWEVLRKARALGAHTYDLGGIDDAGNPGVALFKRKLRPKIASVPGLRWLPPFPPAPAWGPWLRRRAVARLGRRRDASGAGAGP